MSDIASDTVVYVDFQDSVGATKPALETFFDICGEVKRVAIDYGNKVAAVLFSTPEEAHTAALLSGSELAGGTLRVERSPLSPESGDSLLTQLHEDGERVSEARAFGTIKASDADEWSTIRIQHDDAPTAAKQPEETGDEWSTIRMAADPPEKAVDGEGVEASGEWSTMRMGGGDNDTDAGTMKLDAGDTGTMVLGGGKDDDPFADLFNDDDDQFFLAPRPQAARRAAEKKKKENPNAKKRPTVTRAQRMSQERRRSQMMSAQPPGLKLPEKKESRSPSAELNFVDHLSPRGDPEATDSVSALSPRLLDTVPARRVSPREQTMQAPDPEMSRCYGKGIEGGAVGQITRFFVELRDARALPCLIGDIQCTLEEPTKKKKPKIVKLNHKPTSNEGVYDVTYVPKVAGLHLLHVTVALSKKERIPIQGSPFTVIVSNVVKEKERKRPKVCDVCQEGKVAAKLMRHGHTYFLCRPCVNDSTQTFNATGTLRLEQRMNKSPARAAASASAGGSNSGGGGGHLAVPGVPSLDVETSELITCFSCKKETEFSSSSGASTVTCHHCGSTILVAAAPRSPRPTDAASNVPRAQAASARTLKVSADSCERCKQCAPDAVVALGDGGGHIELCRACLVLLRERTPPDVCEKCAVAGSRPVAKVTLSGGKSLWLCGGCNLVTADLQVTPAKCQYCFERKPAAKMNKGSLKMFLCRECVKPVTLRVQRKDADAKMAKIGEIE